MSLEKPFSYIGIPFRSSHHRTWFKICASVYIFYLACLALNWTVRTHIFFSLFVMEFVQVAVVVYLFAGVRALIAVVIKERGTYFSIDCVWFNWLMAGLYALPIALKLLFLRIA